MARKKERVKQVRIYVFKQNGNAYRFATVIGKAGKISLSKTYNYEEALHDLATDILSWCEKQKNCQIRIFFHPPDHPVPYMTYDDQYGDTENENIAVPLPSLIQPLNEKELWNLIAFRTWHFRQELFKEKEGK